MAVPRHVRISFRGRFQETPETWSHSHNVRRPSNAETFGLGDFDVDGLVGLWDGFASVVCSVRTVLTDVRIYDIGTDGRMVGNPIVELLTSSTERVGNLDSVIYPPQVALVVTTVAPNRGPARYGRFYVPGPGMLLSSDSRLNVERRDQVAAAARTFLNGIRDSYQLAGSPDTVDINPINVSTLGGNGAGTTQNISEVRVGRVMDTQRRRRANMDEDYGALAL